MVRDVSVVFMLFISQDSVALAGLEFQVSRNACASSMNLKVYFLPIWTEKLDVIISLFNLLLNMILF